MFFFCSHDTSQMAKVLFVVETTAEDTKAGGPKPLTGLQGQTGVGGLGTKCAS